MSIQSVRHLKRELEDAKAYSGELAWAPQEAWYAFRTTPGAQRSPSITGELPRKRDEQQLSVVERNLKGASFEAYMPTIRRDVIHHRTRKWIDRRFPLFVGYVFVNVPKGNFFEVELVDGVGGVIRPGNSKFEPPFKFPDGLIGRLRFAEFDLEQDFLHRREANRYREELWARTHAGQPSRSEMRSMFPKGTSIQLNHISPFAQHAVSVLNVTSKGTIRATVEALDNAIVAEIPLAHVRDVD